MMTNKPRLQPVLLEGVIISMKKHWNWVRNSIIYTQITHDLAEQSSSFSLGRKHAALPPLDQLRFVITCNTVWSRWLCESLLAERSELRISENRSNFLQVHVCETSPLVRAAASSFQVAAGTNAKSQECISKRIRHHTSTGAPIP